MEEYINYLKYELNRSPLTVGAYLRDLREFGGWLGDPEGAVETLAGATTADMRMWLASLSKRGETPVTVRRKAQSLRAYYRFLLKQGVITANPASALILPKIPKRLPDLVKGEDVESLLESRRETLPAGDLFALRDSLIVEMLYSLGLRRAELVGLDDSDVSFSAGEIKVTGKRDKQRIVPAPDALLARIREWQEARDAGLGPGTPDGPLFRNAAGRISTSVVYHAVSGALKELASSGKGPHSLRHTFATEMLNGGADINTVKEFLGHASLSTTQIYTHVSFAEMRKAYSSAHPRTSGRASRSSGEEGRNEKNEQEDIKKEES